MHEPASTITAVARINLRSTGFNADSLAEAPPFGIAAYSAAIERPGLTLFGSALHRRADRIAYLRADLVGPQSRCVVVDLTREDQLVRLRFCRATFAACFPSAVRTDLGKCAIVLFSFAAAAAFFIFRLAALRCFVLAIGPPEYSINVQ